jgi:hypothetical protein
MGYGKSGITSGIMSGIKDGGKSISANPHGIT